MLEEHSLVVSTPFCFTISIFSPFFWFEVYNSNLEVWLAAFNLVAYSDFAKDLGQQYITILYDLLTFLKNL